MLPCSPFPVLAQVHAPQLRPGRRPGDTSHLPNHPPFRACHAFPLMVLPCTHRYVPPSSAQAAALAADRDELEAALRPADAAALRQRGDALFRCIVHGCVS